MVSSSAAPMNRLTDKMYLARNGQKCNPDFRLCQERYYGFFTCYFSLVSPSSLAKTILKTECKKYYIKSYAKELF